MTQGLLQASAAAANTTSTGKSTPLAPLMPQTVADLSWLGLSAATLQAISPFVTLLPVRTPVNLNTAPPEVLLASVNGLELAQARQLVQSRATKPIDTLQDAEQRIGNPAVHLDVALHAVSTRFFSITGQLRVGQTTVQERSVVQRDGLQVKVLSRQREVLDTSWSHLQ
jgi:general secretion pathway protein K